MTRRTLIAGTGYFDTPDKIQLFRLWAKLIERFSPECDVVVVDSHSPTSAQDILPDYEHHHINLKATPVVLHRFGQAPKRLIYRMPTNQGHPIYAEDPSRETRWINNFVKANGYERFCYMETDLLFARSVTEQFEKMEKAGVKVSSTRDPLHQFLESQLVFFDGEYLSGERPLDKYCEEYRPREAFAETTLERVFGDNLFLLPLRGFRNDTHVVTAFNIHEYFPYGCDYISHCSDFSVYVAFLEMNNVR